jgi:hypothetical protein
MEELNWLKKRIESKALILSCPVFLIGLVFLGVKFSLGLITGIVMSIFNFRLLAKQVVKSSISKLPLIFFIRSYFLRYLLMGLMLWVAINISPLCFLGASIGLFMIKVAIYVDRFLLLGRCKTQA